MGLLRNLTTEEILWQVWLALGVVRDQQLPALKNVVFMGMGEPLNNLANVSRAVRQLTSQRAFGFSKRGVLVSTVGPSPQLIRQAAAILPCKLAWSVHAADDELRRRLVPTTRHSMVELRETLRAVVTERRSSKLAPGGRPQLVVQVTLLAGVNDEAEHANQLADLLQPSFSAKELLVNLIPYNQNELPDITGTLFAQPEREKVLAFQASLRARGLVTTVRQSRGGDERAACGQLVTERPQQRRKRSSSVGRSAAVEGRCNSAA